ncbi:rnhA operon protein [Halorhabdus sp. CBA1104]|uniref:DUF7108 family protein n=1 Tax=Halorhabdus sp. CBA1104 TaxID=1380432 RepID=UPI0012B3EEEB|nr:rnhA operon protein [Halorhabdus sp. CBA1104]QGN07556.1 rnhA operon protein [Halorhabdus sp. CBA1104]
MTDDEPAPAGEDSELPPDVLEEAVRLTRLARRTDGERAETHRQRRDAMLATHGYEARLRADDDGDVLVCYPAEWLRDGEVVFDRIEDRSRGVERPLAGEDDWDVVEAANREIVARVGEHHGPVHEANVRAFADFLGNHHVCRIAVATSAQVREFREEYYPRNVWPDDEQRAVLEQSLRIAFDVAGVEHPPV